MKPTATRALTREAPAPPLPCRVDSGAAKVESAPSAEGPPVRASDSRASTVSDALAAALAELGVTHAFGILGGAIVPFCAAVSGRAIDIVHTRHETGAAFAAMEAYWATGRPAVLFTTTGPGLVNALNGIAAARWEGAKLIVVSGATPAAQRGRWAFQETGPHTLGSLGRSAALFHFAATIEDPAELPGVVRRLTAGISQPGGFVAHVALPIDVQRRPASGLRRRAATTHMPVGCDEQVVERCAEVLRSAPFALWLGFGARGAAPLVRALVARTGAPVICSPRAKGVFPEDDPRFVGVTGLGGDPSVGQRLGAYRTERTLVLGTRLGEFTSFWREDLVPPCGFIHVDVDPDVPGAAYPAARTVAVQAEVGAFVRGLLERLPANSASSPPELRAARAKRGTGRELIAGSGKGVRTRALMRAVQRVVVEESDAIVLTEAGNAFVWCTRELRFKEPGRYRVSTGYGSMGHAVAGVVGAALARGGKAVSIAGDGAMLMQTEVSTAVQYAAPAVWIILNDARYGMVADGVHALGFAPLETEIPRVDFVLFARALGADGVRVEHETELESALQRALAASGPFVVDVVLDGSEVAPFDGRIDELVRQGATSRR